MEKISVIMPTYNDCESIKETLDSLMMQTYNNWELVIVDDGSTDNTKKVIEQYVNDNDKENKIKYIYQENGDQLNAILNGIQHLSGEYVYLLHSDDLLDSNDVFDKCVKYMQKHKKCDALTADLTIIDENSNIKGIQKIEEYKKQDYILAIQELWLGRNLFVDFAFHRAKTFFEEVKNNYVIWNTPYWINFNNEFPTMLNVQKADFHILKYRVHSGNYVNSYMGKLNVINGELRTLVSLMKYYNIPAYKLQYFIFRVFNKLKLFSLYRPIYSKKEQNNKGKIIEFVIRKRFSKSEEENVFLKALILFYKNQIKREIKIDEVINENSVYQGKDNAKFNKSIVNGTLSNIYKLLIKEMEKGFDVVIVSNNDEKNKMEDILRFLCIRPFVTIKIESK